MAGRDLRANRWAFVSTALASPTIDRQAATVRAISPPGVADLYATFTVGACFAGDQARLDQLFDWPDIDFSLGFESMLRFGSVQYVADGDRARLLRHLSDFAEAAVRDRAGPVASFMREFQVRLGRLVPDGELLDLNAFRGAIAGAKRGFHDVLGPDLTSALQVLCDPAMTLSHRQLEIISQLMHDWQLTRTFASLLLLRMLGPYQQEREFLRLHFPDLVAPFLTKASARMAANLLGCGPRVSLVRPRSNEYVVRLVWLFSRISWALSYRQPRALTEALAHLYCHDPALTSFLDWTKIYEVLEMHRGKVDAQTTFVTFLMNGDFVRRRFPYVALATGKGALISDLTSLIDPRRRSDAISPLLSQIRTLPGRAAATLTLAILERPIVERIASALPRPRPWPEQLPPVDGTRVSLVRIDAIRTACEKLLIPEALANELTEQEIDHLRMQYFQGRMRTGRVRIPWEEIERIIKNLAAADVPAFRALSAQRNDEDGVTEVLPRLARFVADHITDQIIYESKIGIDHALSNNLRHGIVLPRFLRAFDDAFQTTVSSRRVLSTWDESVLIMAFGSHTPQLLALRDFVSDTIKTFIDTRLTMSQGGDFDPSLRSAIAERILRHFRSGSGRVRPARLERSVGTVARRQIASHLSSAGRYLADDIRKSVMAELRKVRSGLRSSPSPTTGALLDCLETNLHEASDEVKEWIGVTRLRGDAIPFRLIEVVNLQLLSTSLSAWYKLKVRTRCLLREGSLAPTVAEFSIAGKYLELFQEVIHNLFSNAFKHSGESLKTVVTLDLIVAECVLVIRCTNSISADKVEEVVRNHTATLALARSGHSEQARRDQLSGFQKIRHAFDKAFGRQPVINIPPISMNSRSFLVEITVKHPGDVIVT